MWVRYAWRVIFGGGHGRRIAGRICVVAGWVVGIGVALGILGAVALALGWAGFESFLAGAAVIDADGLRTPDEIEFLRVIAAALGCPVSLPA